MPTPACSAFARRTMRSYRPASLSLSLTRPFSNHARQRPRLHFIPLQARLVWRPIPVGLGILCVGLLQGYKVATRDDDNSDNEIESDDGQHQKPKRRPKIRPNGPWQVRIMSTLPLKAMSRLWGRFNELDIPYYLRVPGFRLYAWIFGVNLDEASEPDLHAYPNLAAFFYRSLKPGVRPLDPDPNALLSPSDGRIIQFGRIEGGDIEQIKGMTYTIEALLGRQTPPPSLCSVDSHHHSQQNNNKTTLDEELVRQDEEFARLNGISYTLPDLLNGTSSSSSSSSSATTTTATTSSAPQPKDESVEPSAQSVAEVSTDLALGEKKYWYSTILAPERKTALFYAVVYLAPGDYHRYHSPVNWVVECRRHFAGELYSVSPYLQRTLPGLFTLNERVVLLGRWRWGFFSLVPVGATNVGSIVVNIDHELRTNSLTTDTAADRAAEDAARRGEPYLGFVEATYAAASRVLGGHALRRGEEMGGFRLGSTVVLVFEAPVGSSVEDGTAREGWKWAVEKGQRVKMGQALGRIE